MNLEGHILALNAGSSSLKLGLFNADGLEHLSEQQRAWNLDGGEDARGALRELLAGIEMTSIIAVGHRIVHGGSRFTQAIVINGAVRSEIETLSALAPLHNRPALAIIDAVSHLLPHVPQIAVFDTAFHATLPPKAYIYALPYGWHERWGIRRFGFHGLSHAYCASRAADILGQPIATLKLVTCHLGSGCSLAAIANGQSIATTMGFTPLDGIVMATRPGAIDPGILTYVLRQTRMSGEEMESALYRESGLYGLSGISGDMREILKARADGDPRAALAFDIYVERLRQEIAAMAASLGGLDALVFTGGVGEHASVVRAATCQGLDWMGIALHASLNTAADPDCEIAEQTSAVRVLVCHTREELMVARETRRLLYPESGSEHSGGGPKSRS